MLEDGVREYRQDLDIYMVAAALAESLDKPFSWAVRVLVWQHATQLGTPERGCRYFGIRRLRGRFETIERRYHNGCLGISIVCDWLLIGVV